VLFPGSSTTPEASGDEGCGGGGGMRAGAEFGLNPGASAGAADPGPSGRLPGGPGGGAAATSSGRLPSAARPLSPPELAILMVELRKEAALEVELLVSVVLNCAAVHPCLAREVAFRTTLSRSDTPQGPR
jgi:hypothetical protein